MIIYVVQPGDTIDSIASYYDIGTDSIIYNNQLSYPYRLAIGQALLLTVNANNGNNDAEKRTVMSGGYAYPFIRRFTLTETLPYLTDLFVFSYGFTTEGELIPPSLDDTWMIELALMNNTRPILTLTPFGKDGQFSNYLINVLVNSPSIQENLIDNLLGTMSGKNYGGIDIDFEYILAEEYALPPIRPVILYPWLLHPKPPMTSQGFSMAERTTGFWAKPPTTCCL